MGTHSSLLLSLQRNTQDSLGQREKKLGAAACQFLKIKKIPVGIISKTLFFRRRADTASTPATLLIQVHPAEHKICPIQSLLQGLGNLGAVG